MTVRDAVSVLKHADTIHLAWNQSVIGLNPKDNIVLDSFGGYKVDYIFAARPDEDGILTEYEIGIAVRPIKEDEE